MGNALGDAPSSVSPPQPVRVNRALVDTQSHQRCAVCRHAKQYCQQVGHTYTPVVTCESCVHMGKRYWGSDDFPIHFCDKGDARRAAAFKSTGDAAEDFMQEFRRFYDAGPKNTNCGRFFEAKSNQNLTLDGASPENTALNQSTQPSGDRT